MTWLEKKHPSETEAEAKSREQEMKGKIHFQNCVETHAVEESLHKAVERRAGRKGDFPEKPEKEGEKRESNRLK